MPSGIVTEPSSTFTHRTSSIDRAVSSFATSVWPRGASGVNSRGAEVAHGLAGGRLGGRRVGRPACHGREGGQVGQRQGGDVAAGHRAAGERVPRATRRPVQQRARVHPAQERPPALRTLVLQVHREHVDGTVLDQQHLAEVVEDDQPVVVQVDRRGSVGEEPGEGAEPDGGIRHWSLRWLRPRRR
jgi:hypothetical protein